MYKIWTILVLGIAYILYSGWIYNDATDFGTTMSAKQIEGKQIYQENNCQSCHQIFGLGGYLGPELTSVMSDKNRGEAYARAFLENGGGTRMPQFNFTKQQVDAILDYLKYVDVNAQPMENIAN
ncbi:MAG: cytochrome c [Bacteroidetes bacterium]|nr:cytochrome c [Bacteroidota bacterium]